MYRLFIALGLALVLAGCSNKPDDASIVQQVSGQLAQRYPAAIFDVLNLHKSNGIPRDDNTYIAEVEYDLRFKVGLDQATAALQPQSGSIFSAGVEAARLGVTYGDFKAGDTLHRKERVRFVRAEKGWLIDEEPGSRP